LKANAKIVNEKLSEEKQLHSLLAALTLRSTTPDVDSELKSTASEPALPALTKYELVEAYAKHQRAMEEQSVLDTEFKKLEAHYRLELKRLDEYLVLTSNLSSPIDRGDIALAKLERARVQYRLGLTLAASTPQTPAEFRRERKRLRLGQVSVEDLSVSDSDVSEMKRDLLDEVIEHPPASIMGLGVMNDDDDSPVDEAADERDPDMINENL
jgi:hypothetical protein